MKKSFSILLVISAALLYNAQTSKKEEIFSDIAKTGGVYYAYPKPSNKLTAIPSGYQEFYVSHYGRHGSRWLINDKDFSGVMDVLKKSQ